MNPDYAHVGDPITNLAEECAEVIQECMKVKRFGENSINPKTGETSGEALLREIGDLEVRLAQAKHMLKHEDCIECRGYGIVSDYAPDGDFLGPKECKPCKGTGSVLKRKKRASKPKNGWKCPINYEGCVKYCGSYGCGG